MKDKQCLTKVSVHPSPFYCKSPESNCMFLRELCGYSNNCALLDEPLKLNKAYRKPLKHLNCPGKSKCFEEIFIETIFEVAFGDDAINKEYTHAEVTEKLREFSAKALRDPELDQKDVKFLINVLGTQRERFVTPVFKEMVDDIMEKIEDYVHTKNATGGW